MNVLVHAPVRSVWLAPTLGALVWAIFLCLGPGWAPALFLLAPLVQVPLALQLLSWPVFLSRFGWLALPASWLLVPAFLLDQGWTAAALTLPWWFFTLGLAGVGLISLRRNKDLGESLAFVYLAIGASWLVLARAGIRPLGFENVIVLATAVHFHYAGFILPLLVGKLIKKNPGKINQLLLGGILLGVPGVAMGITLSAWETRLVELVAVFFMALVCLGFAWQQGRGAWQKKNGVSRFLLLLSSLALAVAMTLAMVYVVGTFSGTNWLDIPKMLRYHGAVQALAFSLPALLAWTIELNVPGSFNNR
jgi:hypothetical protein